MASYHKQKKTPAVQQEDVKEAELATNGKWGVAITLMCYFYGNVTVAANMPKDPRLRSSMLTMSPIPTLLSSLAYIAVVTWLGPKFMRNRKPVKGLKYPMMFYNVFQVLFNLWIFVEIGINGWFGSYSLFCEPCNFTNDPKAVRMMNVVYWYYISKFIDFIDTMFFVMHKKYDHISLLHVCHHSLMPVCTWFGVIYQPGGHHTFMGFLNSFVHVLMYTYYLLSAMGPRMRPYLWWKKYITTVQMIQFTALFVHNLVTMLFLDCNVPYQFSRWVGSLAIVFQILFTDFYIKAYQKKGKSKIFTACKLDNDMLRNLPKEELKYEEESMNVEASTGAISKFASTSKEKNDDEVDKATPRKRVLCQ